VSTGAVESLDSRDCYFSTQGSLIAAVGVSDLVVVVTGDTVLVAHREATQKVKAMVERLRGEPTGGSAAANAPVDRSVAGVRA
jgi:mannose-1-phosphate guanylyltransferase